MKTPIRLLIWTCIPTHHQSAFLEALRSRGFDVVVHYYERVEADRLSMGWGAHSELPAGERYVPQSLQALELCPDWRDRIHIIPGYNTILLWQLTCVLVRQQVPWLHWSEHSWPRLKAHATFPVKRLYGLLVDRYALGALAIGDLARREFIRWGIHDEKIRFLPYAVTGVQRVHGLESEGVPGEGPRFLFLGQLCARKGIDLLLAAMHDVLASHPGARLELSGADRSDGAYAHEAERLGIAHATTFTGVINAAQVGAVLQRCDVLVLPSRHDGWGVVLNEAASAGKAIIASDACGAAHHLVLPEVNGFRFPSGQVPALAQAMMAYCRDPGLVYRHGAQSLRIFESFTPDRNAQRFADALDSLETQSRTQRARLDARPRRY